MWRMDLKCFMKNQPHSRHRLVSNQLTLVIEQKQKIIEQKMGIVGTGDYSLFFYGRLMTTFYVPLQVIDLTSIRRRSVSETRSTEYFSSTLRKALAAVMTEFLETHEPVDPENQYSTERYPLRMIVDGSGHRKALSKKDRGSAGREPLPKEKTSRCLVIGHHAIQQKFELLLLSEGPSEL
ncbi:hypothetical protein TNCV_4667271 [Trichonephila clavipes]|nr:hypothetical protein TNCV_4667271 [Trichonephila clavipes]